MFVFKVYFVYFKETELLSGSSLTYWFRDVHTAGCDRAAMQIPQGPKDPPTSLPTHNLTHNNKMLDYFCKHLGIQKIKGRISSNPYP